MCVFQFDLVIHLLYIRTYIFMLCCLSDEKDTWLLEYCSDVARVNKRLFTNIDFHYSIFLLGYIDFWDMII